MSNDRLEHVVIIGQIVTDQSFKAGDQDFKAQLTTIKGKNPEAIYVPGHGRVVDAEFVRRQRDWLREHAGHETS